MGPVPMGPFRTSNVGHLGGGGTQGQELAAAQNYISDLMCGVQHDLSCRS